MSHGPIYHPHNAKPPDDIIVSNLKARWFDLVRQEQLDKTPDVTRQLDHLTEAIRKLETVPVGGRK